MLIEKGELFSVVRGIELSSVMDFDLNAFFAETTLTKEYDRSHEGHIYKAMEICGPLIAAERVFSDKSSLSVKIGEKLVINTKEVEIWPITEQYLNALRS